MKNVFQVWYHSLRMLLGSRESVKNALKIVAFLFFVLFVLTAFSPSLNAVTVTFQITEEDIERLKDLPALQRFYRSCELRSQIAQGNENPSRYTNTDLTFCDMIASLATTFYGADTLGDSQTLKQNNPELYYRYMAEVPYYMRVGLVQTTYETTMSVFEQPLHFNATSFYAHEFIPKQIQDVFTTVTQDDTVYAASNPTYFVIGSKPSSENAYKKLNEVVGKFWLGIFKLTTGLFVLAMMVAGIMMIVNRQIGGQTPITIMMVVRNALIGYVGAFLSFGIAAFFFNLTKFFILLQGKMVEGVYEQVVGTLPQPQPYNASFFKSLDKNLIVIAYPGGSMQLYNFFMKGIVELNYDQASEFLEELFGPKAMKTRVGKILIRAGGFILGIFYAIAFLFSLIRLLVFIIKTLFMMIIDTIFAPLIFLAGSLPGRESTITLWMKRMFTRSLAPAVAYLLVNLGITFLLVPLLAGSKSIGNIETISVGVIPQVGWGTATLMGIINLGAIIMLVLINLAASADKILQEMFGIQETAVSKTALAALQKVPIVGRFAKNG